MDSKDPVRDLLLDALRCALASPGEHRLFRAGKLAGLFPGRSHSCAQAAARGLDDGLLRRTRLERKGKTEIDWVEVTPRGVEFLHRHESPVQAVHELRAVLRANQDALPAWLDGMRGLLREVDSRLDRDAADWSQRLQAMERRLDETLRRLEAATPLVPPEVLESHPWAADALNYLDRRRSCGAPGGCPLPELYNAVAANQADLAIAHFHDGLRRLRRRQALELRPVEDPTHMTLPEFALLDGDGVFYLAVR